ncbi:MAG: tRNA epoxyqueuosine(34) reductase QueG [Bacteroidales bacterium]
MQGIIQKHQLSEALKNKAYEIGFSFCGITPARFLEEEVPRLESWLNKGLHGKMAYMANYFDKRLDPRLLVDNAKTVISLAFNYFPVHFQPDDAQYKVSKYAYGADYHDVLRKKLRQLESFLQQSFGNINIRCFVDSAPVLERAWAVLSGIGWIGRNSMLITRRNGSFFFLAEIITDIELEYDKSFGGNYCGDCSRCIDACPTGAITDFKIDANRCISYLTIELKDEFSPALKDIYKNWIFGCDICQDICPWNRFSTAGNESSFNPLPDLFELRATEWEQMEEEIFKQMFRHSALKRTKISGLRRNIRFLNQ